MANTVSSLMAKIPLDRWRDQIGFSQELQTSQNTLLKLYTQPSTLESHLSLWLSKFQPCLFGRIAAKLNLLAYCFLTEDDLSRSDSYIRDKIQSARRSWLKAAFDGEKSGFIIVALSDKLARGCPGPELLELAQRLCSLYLLREISPDVIYTDELYLEKPGQERMAWAWNVGVNYFAANGDQRWWQDHRIPGGLGFSMNSVGHLVRAGIVSKHLTELDLALDLRREPLRETKIDSLGKALEMAMRTISLASEGPSGRATELLPLSGDLDIPTVPQCPVKLPKLLEHMNYCWYRGYYHTDVTLPSTYFRPDVKRPQEIAPTILDFTYLFNEDIDNPDFHTTGLGRRIRDIKASSSDVEKALKGAARSVTIDSVPDLMEALKK